MSQKDEDPAVQAALEALPEVAQHASLGHALQACMRDIDYIQKKKASGLNYSFAAEADIVGALHPLFVKHGLCILPAASEIAKQEVYTTGKGAQMNRVIVKQSYTLLHADSGQERPLGMCGEGSDMGDKGTAKAMTCAYKYVLRELLMLETGDDPDLTPSQQQARAPQQNGARPTPSQPPQKPGTTLDQQFRGACKALKEAKSKEDADKFIDAARKRPFDPAQHKELAAAYVEACERLVKPAPPNDKPPEDDFPF